jgi:hypothetical protein
MIQSNILSGTIFFLLESRCFRFIVDPRTNKGPEGFSTQGTLDVTLFVWSEMERTCLV